MIEKTTYTNGFHSISNDEYHSSNGLSRSMLMHFKRSPYHYWYQCESGIKPYEEPKPAYIFGNLVHTLVLEPHLYPVNFIISPACDRRTKEGKSIYEKFINNCGIKTVITQSQYEIAIEIARAVKSNETMNQLLNSTLIEDSIYFTHKSTGLQCKVRPDAWSGTLAFDLKTAENGSYKSFQNSAVNYGYFLQAAMNYYAFESQGILLDEFIFLVVEKSVPYSTAIYRCLKQDLEYGFKLFDELMMGISHCKNTDSWPSYGIRELMVPRYVNFDEMEQIE